MKQMSFDFESRRSMILARRGMVAASNPLATQAGLQILREGGNAADAAIAAAAVMNVTAPASTGIGGDCFALYYDAKTGNVTAMNGSGRAPAALNIDYLAQQGVTGAIPDRSHHAVTVPGAARGWEDLLKKFGTMPLKKVLTEAIHHAEHGYAVSPVFGASWGLSRVEQFLKNSPNTEDYLPGGNAPKVGQIVKLPGLAKTFKAVADGGADAFYQGETGRAIVETLQEQGSVMTLSDLKNHETTWHDAITTDYRGYTVAEHPPNGQGLAALMALNVAEGWNLGDYAFDDPEKLHLMIEAMRLAFADAKQYIADPATNPYPAGLLSKAYAEDRRALVSAEKAMQPPSFGTPPDTSDTIFLCVVDGEGNACSFINSLFMGFGSGIVGKGTGVFLQNRGAGFMLDANHPNALAGGKRPYHTIIPGMSLKDGALHSVFGVMGGFMQPQGHFQVMNALIDDDVNPQEALDRPRWMVSDGNPDGVILLEEGYSVKTMAALATKGHRVQPITGRGRGVFGCGQIIIRDSEGVLYAGSDPRKDGQAAGY
ncbi:MAG: gamma-glutamyltransferase [Aggregatilineales bacterium]